MQRVFNESHRRSASPPAGLGIRVSDTYDAMSRQAADFICAELRRQPDALICVSAGGTPTRTYELLASRCARQSTLFKEVRFLQIDEWGGLATGDPATCRSDLEKKLLGPLGLSKRYIGFTTDSPDPDADCRQIERWLADNGPIDICILGLGHNGHIAMNEPAHAMVPHAHVAKLAPGSLKHGMLAHLAKKPHYGMSLGMADILQSRRVLLLVNGRQKRTPLKRLLKPEINPRYPASFLWLHPDVTVLCDREAAGSLSIHL